MSFILACFIILGFAVIISQLFKLQIVRGEEYQSLAARQQTRSTILGASRGTIYDRNNKELAVSADVWNVCVSPAELNKDTIDKVAADLAVILDTSKESILERAAKRETYYQRIKMRVDRSVADEVLEYTTQNKVSGVFFEQDTKRYYRYNSLASTVLGFTNYDNHGAYGLESYYDKILSGTPGMRVSAKNAKGLDMDFKYQQEFAAHDGNSIVLTIDEGIQHFLERNLDTAVVEHSVGNRVAGIVMDVKTGAIVAMSSKPDFDPNQPNALTDPVAIAELEEIEQAEGAESDHYKERYKQLRYDQWRNKAISDTYEPGSVFKIITASTAVDNHLVSYGDHFYCSGSIQVSNRTMGCWKKGGHGDQDFMKVMQNSCNPAFVNIGQRIGGKLFYDYMDNFGFGRVTGIDLPGEEDGIMHSLEELMKPGMVELSSNSFGQTFKVTPLQLITATSAAVNGGKLMQPYIVKQVIDPDGNVIDTTQPVVKRQVISEEASEIMQALTEAVVADGSGRKSAIPGYRIGGKTGTSEKLDLLPQKKYVLSFVGFAPMENPQYAILVMLDEPNTTEYGSTIAAPVVGAVFQEMLPYLGISPNLTPEQLAERQVRVPELMYMKPHDAQAELTLAGLTMKIVGNGAMVIRQIPQGGQDIPKGGQVIVYTEEEAINTEISVPAVVGMDAQEANKTLVDAGLNVRLEGVTRDGAATMVSEQWPLPDAQAASGDVVIITLVEKPEQEYIPTQADGEAEMELPQ